jgi:uncharacterized membrane protein
VSGSRDVTATHHSRTLRRQSRAPRLHNVEEMKFLNAIENTGFSIWVRESGSLWSYPTIIFLHSLGLAFVVGLSVAIALRLLGCAPRLPIAPMKSLFPVIWAGFLVNALSGIALLMADASTMLISPIFYIKMASIALAVTIMAVMQRKVFREQGPAGDRVSTGVKVLATASLVLWAGAITAGRLTAYLGPAVGLKGR